MYTDYTIWHISWYIVRFLVKSGLQWCRFYNPKVDLVFGSSPGVWVWRGSTTIKDPAVEQASRGFCTRDCFILGTWTLKGAPYVLVKRASLQVAGQFGAVWLSQTSEMETSNLPVVMHTNIWYVEVLWAIWVESRPYHESSRSHS